MTVYKVEITKLTFDMGAFDGYKLVGYYANKDKAEKVAEERYANRSKVVEGRTVVTEIEVIEQEVVADMNTVYLIKDEKRNYCLFKVGFTASLEQRIYAYTTANPEVECISTIHTQAKSNRNIEKTFHNEIIKRGYQFVNANIDNKSTEWFKVEYNDPFYMELIEKGLNAFKCGRNRKNYGTYTK